VTDGRRATQYLLRSLSGGEGNEIYSPVLFARIYLHTVVTVLSVNKILYVFYCEMFCLKMDQNAFGRPDSARTNNCEILRPCLIIIIPELFTRGLNSRLLLGSHQYFVSQMGISDFRI